MKLLDALLPESRTRLSVGEYLAQTASFSVGGNGYTLPYKTTMPGQKAERIGTSFEGYVLGGLQGNGVVFNLASIRMRVFSEARLMWQQLRAGRPGDLFSTPDLGLFEHPWVGGTQGDLLSLMLLHADFAGSAYVVRAGSELALLRPDWVDILLGDRRLPTGELIGRVKAGYHYFPEGDRDRQPTVLFPEQVAHFAPTPDPLASFRGMSWLTPVLREIEADGAATQHKLAFFENAATPNLAVSMAKEITPEQFEQFVETMDSNHKGVKDAYKTLYTAGGADVSVIGANMQQLDFKVTQGAGETRLAAAAGVPPAVANISEGMQGSALNSGNFGQARRSFANVTMSPLWRNVAGSLEQIAPAPQGSRLWYDARDIPFLKEDVLDAAEILNRRMQTIESGVRAGYEPTSVVAAVEADDLRLLKHTGLFSVQLQPPGMEQPVAPVRSELVRGEDGSLTVNLPSIQIDNHLPAPEVTVERAEQLAPIVNVAAPNVTVENNVPVPSVSVAPAHVEMHMPPEQKVTRRVVRDANGNITKVVEE